MVDRTFAHLPSPAGRIGIFDSGVGGLSVWREVVRRLPHEDTVYFADQAHVPYGPRTQDELRHFCDAIARFLLDGGCKAIVVACNTASAAALKLLRERFPQLPVIGMEPAVKPAAATTRTGVVGILATPATFEGRLFRATAGRHAAHVRLVNRVCHGLAELVEAGKLDGDETDAALRDYLQPVLEANADVIVLGCTHYPFVIDAIRRVAGPQITVIDPAPAIARHLDNVLEAAGLSGARGRSGQHAFYTTADPDAFGTALHRLVGHSAAIRPATWRAGRLVEGMAPLHRGGDCAAAPALALPGAA